MLKVTTSHILQTESYSIGHVARRKVLVMDVFSDLVVIANVYYSTFSAKTRHILEVQNLGHCMNNICYANLPKEAFCCFVMQ